MSLDATVYRNMANLPAHLRERVIVTNNAGELDWRDLADESVFGSNKLEACHERIGNIGLVAILREEIASAFGHKSSLLSTRVVYNGIHAGDFIAAGEIENLSQEIEALDRATQTKRSEHLVCFLAQMRSLITAASREGTGICF